MPQSRLTFNLARTRRPARKRKSSLEYNPLHLAGRGVLALLRSHERLAPDFG